jgi:hypothetical protein
MNIVSVQIYSDQNTPWDRSKIDFPINIENTNWPGNGCGLCNQIFKLISTIAFNNEHDIYVDLFSKDYLNGNTICASEIFDLEEMRKLGHRLYDIVDMDYNQNYVIKTYPGVYMLYHINKDYFINIVKSLRFTSKYENIAKNILVNKGLSNKLVNLVHLRIDIDFKNHIVSTGSLENYLNLIESYREQIYLNCDNSIPLVLLLEETDHLFVKELQKDYDVYMFEKSEVLSVDDKIEGREIFALIDLLTAKELTIDKFIGLEGSTFSLILNYLIECKKSIILK